LIKRKRQRPDKVNSLGIGLSQVKDHVILNKDIIEPVSEGKLRSELYLKIIKCV
jgi:hypothetical protein